MKVLKKGREQKGWARKAKCSGNGNGGGGCGALLLIEEGDLLRTGSHHYDGSSEYFVSFVCPDCRVMTDFSSGMYPGDLWKLKAGPGGKREN